MLRAVEMIMFVLMLAACAVVPAPTYISGPLVPDPAPLHRSTRASVPPRAIQPPEVKEQLDDIEQQLRTLRSTLEAGSFREGE